MKPLEKYVQCVAPDLTSCMSAPLVSRVWRIFATGSAFALFMVGGLMMTITAFPLARMWPGSYQAKGRRIRRLIQISFAAFLRYMQLVGVMRRPVVVGLANLHQAGPCLIVANHPTLIDVVLLVSLIPDCNCVVKHTLWKHFFLGRVVSAAGYIPNHDGPQMIKKCEEGFKLGKPLLLFPEGTRSPANVLRPFNRGAAQIALRTSMPVLPAVLTCSPPTLMKHQRWYEVPSKIFQLTLRFHSALELPAGVLEKENLPLQVRALTRHLEEYFRKEVPIQLEPGIVPHSSQHELKN